MIAVYNAFGRASTRPYIGVYLVLWCKPKSCVLGFILMIHLYFLALSPSVSLLTIRVSLYLTRARLFFYKYFGNLIFTVYLCANNIVNQL